MAGAVPVEGGQLLPGPFRCADDGEAIDPAVGEGCCAVLSITLRSDALLMPVPVPAAF